MNDASYRVAVFAVPDDPHALRDVLVDQLGLHPIDAEQHAHAVPGLLPDRLPEDGAHTLADAISQLGVTALPISLGELPELAHVIPVHHARTGESGLEVVDASGDVSEVVAWGDVALWSVGYVPLRHVSRTAEDRASFLHAAPRAMHDPATMTTSGLELLIVATDRRCLRIVYDEMNYESLAERRVVSATANFRVFVEDLERRAASAFETPSARAFLHHGQLRHYAFHSRDDHRHYVEFHVLRLLKTTR